MAKIPLKVNISVFTSDFLPEDFLFLIILLLGLFGFGHIKPPK
jgi:hypothetical protein